MVSRRDKLRNKWITGGLFFLFSLVWVINNVTDLFLKFDLRVSVSWISWIGMMLVLIYTWYLASEDRI